ncbi:MAG: hypothetical protein ACPHL6_03220 [Rubripirellula sp.]
MRLKALQAHLCLIALLLSNVAGWVHLGCVETAQNCHTLDSAKVEQQVTAGDGCCHHHHGQPHSSESSSASDRESHPSDHGHSPDHDSQQCHICQSFLTLRQAVSLPVVEANTVETPSTRILVYSSAERAVSAIGNSISVRGPPKA